MAFHILVLRIHCGFLLEVKMTPATHLGEGLREEPPRSGGAVGRREWDLRGDHRPCGQQAGIPGVLNVC